MRTQIYFIRHAEAQINIDPLFKGEADCLTEKGVEQTKSLAQRFNNIRIEKIYTSKINRALLTTCEIEKIIDKESVILEFLKERKGTYSNSLEYNNTENFEDFKLRLAEAKKFLENLRCKQVIVVSHANFLKSLVSYITLGDALTENLLTLFSQMLVLDHAAVSKFVFNSEKFKWHMESWNDQTHLL